MDYSFGDIYDCRKYSGLKHFILILGTQKTDGKEIVLYEVITSRIYKAFEELCAFFEDNCHHDKCAAFKRHFKNKNENTIYPSGRLCFTLFLDKDINSLDQDSMVIINGEPRKDEASVLDQLHKDKFITFKTRISDVDIYKLIAIINYSDNLNKFTANAIRSSIITVNEGIKKQKARKQAKR